MKLKSIFACALAITLAGCASGPTIVSNANPGADFTQFETYNFMQPLGTDRSGARTPLSSRLVSSVNRELISRGMSLSDEPDLLVDFMVTTEERLDVRTTPTNSVHHAHWPRGFNTWPAYNTTVRQYTAGTLLIDLIDPATNTLVGEGAAQNRISNTQFTQAELDEIVSKVISDLMDR